MKYKNGFIDIDVKDLVEWNEPNGEGCMVSDMITKEGWKVGYMVRDIPNETMPDSGWTFFKGDEDEEYMSNPDNFHIFAINTVCNYDPDIIPYIHSKIGTSYIRVDSENFEEDDGSKQIFFEMQDRTFDD
jgi:hypothetical protein